MSAPPPLQRQRPVRPRVRQQAGRHPPAPRCCTSPAAVRRWYERELGWPATGHDPVELITGVRFDALELPADAGLAVLRRGVPTGPVALAGGRMLLLVAAGAAEELPGLLEWLEWGGVPLELSALGQGGRMPAPRPPDVHPSDVRLADARQPDARPPDPLRGGPEDPREVARCRPWPVWLRPPEPGREREPALPTTTLSARRGCGGVEEEGAPDLVRLVATAATECHRASVRRAACQPFAFSYASRTVAGTRPRSLTS
ncbi:SCO3374 family protein [Streptomyces sp. URMC 123]|uniref:SCO3374 family protein n=1 Tax=Streptomyces sp. URMC 123 TaxID=3423403 RepID=UPI003F1AF834